MPNTALNLTGMFKINQKTLGWVSGLGLNFGPLQISMIKTFQVRVKRRELKKEFYFTISDTLAGRMCYMLVAPLVNPLAPGTLSRFAGVHGRD